MTGRLTAPIRLVPGAAGHIDSLAGRMRRIDRIECAAMGQTPQQALCHGLSAGARTWTALIGDEPHAMFGVVIEPACADMAIPWFLGSDQVARSGRLLLACGPAIIAAMHRHGRRLCNFVSSDNRQAIRLLELWGFTVEQDPVVTRDVAFRRFIREIK